MKNEYCKSIEGLIKSFIIFYGKKVLFFPIFKGTSKIFHPRLKIIFEFFNREKKKN